MRWRVGVVLCLFAAYVAIGCRDPLAPNIDRNQPPETWITAAPIDTITIKDELGRPVGSPMLPGQLPPGNTIPVRFHLYWAGSDKDGAVAGFYWAVVETLPRPNPNQIFLPNLPGPKPQDYRYTTRTDSFFVFNVAEDIPDRQHAFFIYSVDNQGKPDPTPARFIFNAQDRFPPIPIIEECRCVGTVYLLQAGGGVRAVQDTHYVTDIDDRNQIILRDTCAATSRIDIKWHGQVQVPQTEIIGYRYKLDEPSFIQVGPEVTSVTYNSGVPPDTVPPATGRKIFVLRVVDQAFGTRDSTRRFQLNYAPDTWWAGPDPNSPSLQTKANGERYALQVSGQMAAPVSGSLLSPDSTLILPALRPERKTFFELWKDTVWVRTEGDTVHMNSWIILHGGGYDKDSQYRVRVNPIMSDTLENGDRRFPSFPGGPVLQPGGPNGSPIGFQSVITMALTPNNSRLSNSFTGLYPIFDPNDVFNLQRIAGYHPVFNAGRVFAVMQAQDADGDRDKRIIDGLDLKTRCEAGLATPGEQPLCDKVLSFYVDKAPYFITDTLGLFRPIMPKPGVVDTFTSNIWDLRIIGADDDPYTNNTPAGGPSNITTLRRRITIHGKTNAGADVSYEDPTSYVNQQNISVLIPAFIARGNCVVEVELCDCDQCEGAPGSGRCIRLSIPVYYK